MVKMCPEKQFISVYYDGELPPSWEKKMERHLEDCPECRRRLEIYEKTSVVMGDDEDGYAGVMEAAKERVWQNFGNAIARGPVRRRLTPHIPTAVTAAAAGAIAAAAAIAVMLFVSPNQRPDGFAAANASQDGFANVAVSNEYELNIPEAEPVSNMQELLHYLENDDSSNIIIIKLPERKKFSRYGEPAFINAADYARRRAEN
ncbi:MAG: zf-HC2 domain-containing protein [Spirochaetaceae bacterium]|jgi:hypothetical protein|nr:zf-HC2 domain-containing protein [Spirochaetaceae bacterium]